MKLLHGKRNRQEGLSVTAHRSTDDLPNINGWQDTRPRHVTGYRVRHRVRTTVVMVVAAILVFVGAAAAATFVDIDSTLRSRMVSIIPQDGSARTTQIVDPNAGKSINVLLLGQDTRDGEANAAIGGGDTSPGSHQADTTMVLQISADRTFINLVSIPRDSIVDAPRCETSHGTLAAQHNVMFNSIFASAYAKGGDLASAASCTVTTVNSLTGLDIQQFVVVDFQGLSSMIDAVGGVDICIPQDTKDRYTSLDLKKGLQHLNGTQATQYARMRHGTGTDGSDIMRTTRQQYLIKALLSQALSKNLFTQSGQLYQLAKAALKSLDISTGLANTTTLAGLAMSLKDFDMSRLYAQTVPVAPWAYDANRRVWTSAADDLWDKMREDRPLTVADDTAADSAADGTQSGTPSDTSPANGSDGSASAPQSGTGENTGTAEGTQEAAPQPDPKTGLITQADGTLIDPNTGGIVDPDNGAIKDPNTGEYIGIADRYLNATVCAVPAKQ